MIYDVIGGLENKQFFLKQKWLQKLVIIDHFCCMEISSSDILIKFWLIPVN